VADADLWPLRYLATLLGAGDQHVLRWFMPFEEMFAPSTYDLTKI
jgi:hypothetical protein